MRIESPQQKLNDPRRELLLEMMQPINLKNKHTLEEDSVSIKQMFIRCIKKQNSSSPTYIIYWTLIACLEKKLA